MKKTIFTILMLLIASSSWAACTNTTNYSLCKPAVGDVDWGANVNTNFDTIDTQMKANADDIDTNDTATALNTTHRSSDGSDHSAVVTNSAKVTNATHTGEVTGDGALTIADNVVDEANLKATNAATDNYLLSADTASGGFTWVEASGGAETNSLETTITGIADTEIFVGDGADSGAFVVVSGDATLANTGALTLTANSVDSDEYVDGSIDHVHLGTDIITGAAAVGTFASGDTFLCQEAGVGVRECDYDDIPQDGTGTDDQTIDVFSFADPNISLSLESDGEATKTLDISGLNIDPDNLDDEDQGDVNISSDVWQVQEVQSGAISEAADIDNDIITHAQILDSDQADTKCLYIEDPTADDDLTSIWGNKTANDFLLTEIWAESDQTVNFDLQVDDGTPADVNGTDISPAAGEAEDTTLSGDTTVAAGEELDLVVTSVSGTPTWVSICFTGNWVD